MAHSQEAVTRLLVDLTEGDASAMEKLLPIIYDELRRLAQWQLHHERPDHTFSTSDLVHEAYLKLVRLDRMKWQNRAHFFAIAARAMRQILVNYAVKRKAQKRGAGAEKISLNEELVMTGQRAESLIALDEALNRLANLSDRQHRVVECRFFAGLSIEETAEALQISPATVKRDWALARAWLNRELKAD